MIRSFSLAALVMLIVSHLATTTFQAQAPQLEVTAPTNGASIAGTTFNVEFSANGMQLVPSQVPLAEAGKRPEANRPGEGHVHFMLDLQPVIVWERNEPYTFENVPPGEHQLTVELVNNDHSSLTPPVMRQIRFQTAVLMPNTGSEGVLQSTLSRTTLLVAALLLVSVGLTLRRRRSA